MNILKQIVDERLADVKMAKRDVSIDVLKQISRGKTHRSLKAKLNANTGNPCIIAEMKKASPSAGLLREDYRPVEIGKLYEKAGAAGISILTEPRHFLGSEQDLRAVRGAVDLPILRKDFICDEYQVYETASWGADLILIILAAIDHKCAVDIYKAALKCGLETLVEVHTKEELKNALEFDDAIIGVNSRNLQTLKTDLAVAHKLSKDIPKDRFAIAESGIKTANEIMGLMGLGYNGFLIGETLMKGREQSKKILNLMIDTPSGN